MKARLIIPIVILSLLVWGCAASRYIGLQKEDPYQLYTKAMELQSSGELSQAYSTFIHLWKSYPDHPLAREALFYAATIKDKTDPQKATELYEKFLKLYPLSSFTNTIRESLFEDYLRQKEYDKAYKLIYTSLNLYPGPIWSSLGMRLVNAYVDADKPKDALNTIVLIYGTADTHTKESLLSIWKSTLAEIKTEEDLRNVEKITREPELLDTLHVRMSKLSLGSNIQALGQAQTNLQGQAPEGLNVQESEGKLPACPIGIILPLSGKWGSIGYKILKGIELASNVFSPNKTPNVEFIVRDYASDEKNIPGIIEDLDKNYRVLAIMGPVGEKAATSTCEIAEFRGIPAFVFTQADLKTQEKPFCFNNFVSISTQVKSLLSVARDTGITKFAILYPKDHFGITMTSVFKKLAPQWDIEVVRDTSYSPDEVDFKNEILSLVPALKEQGKEGDNIPTPATPIVPDFDALLIPDTGLKAAMIASYLAYFNIEDVKLFGPSLWNTDDLVKVGGKYIDRSVFVSGFFLDSKLDFVQDFINSFYYTYGYNPSIWEASAFDTANILLNLVKGNMPSRDMLRQRILALKDYPGVTGATSFDDKGNVDKVIFVLRVNGSHITEISP